MTTPLPPNAPSAPDDQLPGEAELAALYRQLPQREPAPALDAAVRHAAAQALGVDRAPLHVERRTHQRESGDWVHPKPLSAIAARAIPSVESAARTRRRHVPHWLVALGSAASLVLVAGLAWHMRSTPTAAPSPVATAAREQTVAAPTATPADRTPASQAIARRAPSPQAAKRQSVAAGHPTITTAEVAAAPPPPMPAPAAKQMRAQATAAAPPPPRPMKAVRLEAPALAPATAFAPAAAPAPPAPPQTDTATQDAAHAASASIATPADELARIEQLFAQGDAREAQQRLLDFHRAHPQWPLPPELQAKLPKP